ncbi:MAG: winged-helix domain-containing protein, partial [Methanosarcinaceae archaeon]
MIDPQIERKLIEIMRIIDENDKPIGARAIADELYSRGYNIGERAVRYHLSILDERGFTEKHGYSGRTITVKGKGELGEALIGDRLGFVITRIEDLIYRTDFDPVSGEGHVIVNISHIDKDDFDNCMEVMTYT